MLKSRDVAHGLLAALWHELEGPPAWAERVEWVGAPDTLPCAYEVSALASASVAAALLSVAELAAVRLERAGGGTVGSVTVNREHAATAFACERHVKTLGWQLPAAWDPLAGDYACRDGFIRLHTNYAYHRDAVLRVLETSAECDAVSAAVRSWDGDTLETALVAAGGCAAFMRSPAQWQAHPQGLALAREPLLSRDLRPCDAQREVPDEPRLPLSGVSVLDLTRVIAGPICTRFLAAYGADVLRVDPPGFEEVGALVCEMTTGKRRALLDLRRSDDRARFEALAAGADLIVHGYRSDALAGLGYDTENLVRLAPNASIVTHDAYGFSGPWATRRGFDSLVQMSCGIAWRGREVENGSSPRPLPVQALDHATGYLLAASACRALTRRSTDQHASVVRTSLARVAQLLMALGDTGDPSGPALAQRQVETWLERAETSFGPVSRVRCPDGIDGYTPRWTHLGGPLGSDHATW
jgi:hypothetical protein